MSKDKKPKNSKSRSINKRMLFQITMNAIFSLFISFVFLILLVTLVIVIGKWEINVPDDQVFLNYLKAPFLVLTIITIMSFVIGITTSIYFGRRFLKPINKLMAMTDKVSKGDFNVQVEDIPDNEIGNLTNNFNIMVSELNKNEMLKQDFISNVSHEFKTPLSAIQGYATLLQDETLSKEERDKYIKTIIESTSRLTTLVNNILKISKLDNHKISLDTEVFYLDEQIRESILSLEKEWEIKSINFDIELDELSINSDKNLLSNVWNNLFANAIKFSNENSDIYVRLTKKDDKAVVIIKDFGCGIKEEALPYIFDKFYQADKSHSIQGNGLGLALVKKIITLVNGDISVESEEGKGTQFKIILPIEKLT